MTALESKDHIIHIRATLVARLYYQQEFDGNLQGALKVIFDEDGTNDDISQAALRVIWAMSKAENKANGISTLNFRQWLKKYGDFDIRDCMSDFLAEIINGFLIRKTDEETPDTQNSEDLTQYLLTVAIRFGIDMNELNELTTQGLYDIFKAFTDKNGGDSGGATMATPAQNEAFWR